MPITLINFMNLSNSNKSFLKIVLIHIAYCPKRKNTNSFL